MVTYKENIIFLDGILSAFSMLIDLTITIVSIDSLNKNCELDFLNFYDFLPSDCIISTSNVNSTYLESFFEKILFKEKSTLDKVNEERKKYIAYKIMDSLEFCFEDVDGRKFDGLEFDRWHITEIEFKKDKISSYSFIFSSLESNKLLTLTFWLE